MLYLLGRGDAAIRWFEVSDKGICTPGALQFTAPTTFIHAARIPKTSCNLMDGEIARLLLLASDAKTIVPVSVIVPRKTYIDFLSDVFPDTKSNLIEDALSAQDWIDGKKGCVKLISLDPSKKKKLCRENSILSSKYPSINAQLLPPPSTAGAEPSNALQSAKATPPERSSLFRFASGKASLSMRMDDLKRCLATVIPNECNPISCNEIYVTFLHDGPGGRIGFRSATDYSRFPPTVPCIQNGSNVMDFTLDPFSKHSLLCACEDGKIRIHDLRFPEEAPRILGIHNARVNILIAHPAVKDVFASASIDAAIKVWSGDCVHFFVSQAAHSMVFFGSKYLAVSCRDSMLRVYDLESKLMIYHGILFLKQAASHEGLKATRLAAISDTVLCSVGFTKSSVREVILYDISTKNLAEIQLDTNPALLEIFYDRDTRLLYASGRGDSYTSILEIQTGDKLGAILLTRFSGIGPTQGVSFIPKQNLDVMNVEVAACWRLTPDFIERVSFTVPRLRKEYFHDDIFCDTIDLLYPRAVGSRWMEDFILDADRLISLKPDGVLALSQAPISADAPKKTEWDNKRVVTDDEKKQQMFGAMLQAAVSDDKAHWEDQVEGVDESEWD